MAPTLDSSLLSNPIIRSPNKPSLSLTFQEMLDGIQAELSKSNGIINEAVIGRILSSYRSNKDDWSKYAFYDPERYKRNLVVEYENYNVMIICWGPGSKSCIHDHSGAHCFMKALEGDLIETRFAMPDAIPLTGDNCGKELCQITENKMTENDTLYIHDKVGLHLVENPSLTKYASSLHVYLPPYKKCKAFDQKTGRARVCKMTFYSKLGLVTGEDEENPWNK